MLGDPPRTVLAKIQENLQRFSPTTLSPMGLLPSAVMLTLIPSSNELSIIMTARSAHLNNHAGEMSFPGGRFDPQQDENLWKTALRETQEEVGISPEKHQLLGALDDFPTVTGYLIRPYISLYTGPTPVQYKVNSEEVAHLVEIPLSFLLSLESFQEKKHYFKGILRFISLSFDYGPRQQEKFHVWGASAHILADFLRVSLQVSKTSSHYFRPTISQILTYRKDHLQIKKDLEVK